MTAFSAGKSDSCENRCRSHGHCCCANPEPSDRDVYFEDACRLVFTSDQVNVLKAVIQTQPEQFSSCRDIIAEMIERIRVDIEVF
jgi:hypothetical protein